MTDDAVTLAHIAAELRYIRQSVDAFGVRLDTAEKDRLARGELAQHQYAELRQSQALHGNRLEVVERKACEIDDEVVKLRQAVDRLTVTVGVISGALGLVGVWLINRFLAGLP